MWLHHSHVNHTCLLAWGERAAFGKAKEAIPMACDGTITSHVCGRVACTSEIASPLSNRWVVRLGMSCYEHD